MSFQPGNLNLTGNAGLSPENLEVPHIDVRVPSVLDIAPPGKTWLNKGSAFYVNLNLTSIGGTLNSNWALLGTVGGALNTLTGDSGGAISPTSNNITLAGTGSQITTVGSGSTITFSLIGPYTPTTYTAHGVLVGEGTSSITALAVGSNGQVLLGSTGADPAFGTLTSTGSTLTYTTGAHSLNIDLTIPVVVASGGTGATTLTGVLTGNGTSAVTANAVTQYGVLVGGASNAVSSLTVGTNGQVLLGSTGANPAFATLTTSTGIGFTTGAGSLALNVVQGGYKVDAASTGVALVAQNAYTVTQAAQTSFSLPATAAVGDRFLVASALGNTSGWIITQGAGQEIWAGTNHTTNGATGTLAGAIHTSVELMCTIANVEFVVVGGSGLTGLTFT